MQKSKVKKMKLASLLLLSSVLIPDIAYADEEIDESIEAETAVDPAEIQDAEQTINEQETESEENAGTPVITPGEAATEEVAPDVNTYNNDVDTNTESNSENVEEEAVENSGGENEESAPILQPAEPERNEETAQEDEEAEVSEGEEETPSDGSDNNEADFDNSTLGDREDNVQQETPEEEPEMPVLPTEPIEPLEPVEPETPAEPNEETTETVPEQQEEISAVEQPSDEPAENIQNTLPEETETNTETSAEESVAQDQGTLGTEKKKLYRYDYGDILNGISFSEESITEDLSTLDQRVTRVMSSKIIEEKDLTEAQKLKLEEKVKAEDTASYDGEELPNTGEADSTNYAFAGLLTIFGAVLVFMSKKLKTDN